MGYGGEGKLQIKRSKHSHEMLTPKNLYHCRYLSFSPYEINQQKFAQNFCKDKLLVIKSSTF